METRYIAGFPVSAIGLGAMPMSIEGRPAESQAIATIHAALDAGVRLIDTADAYHRDAGEVGHNEVLVARALKSWDGDATSVLVSTKGGHTRPGDGSWGIDGSPEYLKRAAEDSLKRLGGDALGLYFWHRPDPKVPYEDSVGAIRDLLDAGTIRFAGVSNASPDQIRTSQQILGGRLAAVQNQFGPNHRRSEPELALCDQLGVAFLPWSPLGGIGGAGRLGSRYAPFQQVADARGVSPQVVCLAWELAKSPIVIPIPGASRAASILDSVRAMQVLLSPQEMATLDAA
jgi:aryl-alcohol dehydrogenase-like predicted oxidoreductase